MKKLLIPLQMTFLSLTISLMSFGCVKLDSSNNKKIFISSNTRILDISTVNVPVVNAKVELNLDIYQNVLISDNPSSFKSILVNTFNQWAKENNIQLRYAIDYRFSLPKEINPYSVITKIGPVMINVSANNNNNKIKGTFNVPVNFLSRPKSINEIYIPRQIFNEVIFNETNFFQALKSCFKVIHQEIKKVAININVERFRDYSINIEGHIRKEIITEENLGIHYVNVNAITSDLTHLLEGNFSFELKISIPEHED